MAHLDDGVDPFASAQIERRYFTRLRHQISIQRGDKKFVACKSNLNILSRTGVEDVEQNALPSLDANRLTVTKRLAVDRADAVADLDHAGTPVGFTELLHGGWVVIVVHVEIKRLPLMRGEEDLLVIAPGVF